MAVGKYASRTTRNSTRDAAIDKEKSERLLAKERAMREAEERTKADRIKAYKAATVLEIEIIQVVKDGCLARVRTIIRKGFFSN
jgi:hypothetical protein